MPLALDHPLLRDAPELLTKLLEWQTNQDMLQGSVRLSAAIEAGDYRNAVFSDSLYPEYALLALHQDKISQAQFATIMYLWAAHQDFQPQIVENRITSSDPFTKENQVLLQYLAKTNNRSHGYKVTISQAEFKKILEKMLDPKTPDSEKVYFTFEYDSSKSEKTTLANSLKQIYFSTFMPRRERQAPRGTDLFIIPSHSLVQAFIDCSTTSPVQLQPAIGATAATGVLGAHMDASHPVGISFPDFQHEYADKLRSGCLGFIYHDWYHAVLVASNRLRAAYNRMSQIALQLKTQHPTESDHIQKIAEGLIDQEVRIYGTGLEEDQNLNLMEIFVISYARFLVDIEGIAKKIAEFSKVMTKRDEIDALKQIIDTCIQSIELNPSSLKVFKKIFADLIHHAAEWQTKFQFTPAGLYKVISTPNSLLSAYLESQQQDYFVKAILPSIYSSDELLIRIQDKALSLLTIELINPSDYLNDAGKKWWADHQAHLLKLKNAIAVDDVESFKQLDVSKDEILVCIQQKANKCLAELLKQFKLDFVNDHKNLLQECAKAHNGAAAVMLCEFGAKINVPDANNRTPLEHFLIQGDTCAALACLQREVATQSYIDKVKSENTLPNASIQFIDRYSAFQKEYLVALNAKSIEQLQSTLINYPEFTINTPIAKSSSSHFEKKMNSASDRLSTLFLLVEILASNPDIDFIKAMISLGLNSSTEMNLSVAEYYAAEVVQKNKILSGFAFYQISFDQLFYDFLTTFDQREPLIKKIKNAFKALDYVALESLLKSLPRDQPLPSVELLECIRIKMPIEKLIPCLELLLRHGLNLNDQISYQSFSIQVKPVWSMLLNQSTPLELLTLYVRYGADANVHGLQDETILGLAITHYIADPKQSTLDAIRLILEYGADPNSWYSIFTNDNREWESPLHVATRINDMNLIGLLLEYGADCHSTLHDKSALMHAKENNQTVLVIAFENAKRKEKICLPAYAKSKIAVGQYRDLSKTEAIADPTEACTQLETLLENIIETYENYGQLSKAEIKAIAGLMQSEPDFDLIDFASAITAFSMHLAELKKQRMMPTIRQLQKELEELSKNKPDNAQISQLRFRCIKELAALNAAFDELTTRDLAKNIIAKKPEKFAGISKAVFFQVCPEMQDEEKIQQTYRGLSASSVD